MPQLEFYEYETIVIPYQYADDRGVAMALPDGVVIEAQARDKSDNLICQFEVNLDDPAGGAFSLFTNDVIARGEYQINIYFTTGDYRKACPPFALVIKYSPTVPSGL